MSPISYALRRDKIPRKEHLHRVLPRDVTRERDHWSRAEKADVDPGGREPRVFVRDGEVARGHELAPRRARDAVHPGDDGLRAITMESIILVHVLNVFS